MQRRVGKSALAGSLPHRVRCLAAKITRMPQRAAIGNCSRVGNVETPCRGNETLIGLGDMMVSSTALRGSNVVMAAGTRRDKNNSHYWLVKPV